MKSLFLDCLYTPTQIHVMIPLTYQFFLDLYSYLTLLESVIDDCKISSSIIPTVFLFILLIGDFIFGSKSSSFVSLSVFLESLGIFIDFFNLPFLVLIDSFFSTFHQQFFYL